MKVIQINALGATLSTGRTTREMHDYFQNHEIESYIATACNKDCKDAYAISTMNGMHIDTMLTLLDGLELYHSHIQTRRFLKYLDIIQPDIVHLRVLHQSFINIGMLLQYLAEKNIPTVITLHDLWFITGKCCYYHNYPCDKWKTGCHHCVAMKDDPRHRLFDRTSKMWTDKKKWLNAIPKLAVIGNSDWTTQQAQKSFLQKTTIIERIYNWIDLDVFQPRDRDTCRKKHGLPIDKKLILGVSASWTMGDRKGFDGYLRLAEILPEEYCIVLIGNISSEIVLPENIIAMGRTNSTDMLVDCYSAADVYLNLSKGETFGKVSAEALACGTPVIGYNNTANPEMVPPNGGVVIDSVEPNAIMEALAQVFSKSKEDYQGICVSYAHSLFDMQTNIEKYIDVYKRLLFT